MAGDLIEFESWLCSRLRSVNLDEEVLGQYITGILDTDDSTKEEKYETLNDILQGMMEEPDENQLSSEIITKWTTLKEEKDNTKQEIRKPNKLAAVMKEQALLTKVHNKGCQKLDSDLKEHVIAQYDQQSDDDDDDDVKIISDSEDEKIACNTTKKTTNNKSDQAFLFENTNASAVKEKEKEKRDKQRVENEDKKLKNKQDREKQKEKNEQRKEKEKRRTQKQEKRR